MDRPPETLSASAWVDKLCHQSAKIRDFVEDALSALDRDIEAELCPYGIDTPVMLRRTDRRQKRMTPYEPGWYVADILSPSTVKIAMRNDGHVRTKIVNIDLLKLQPAEEVHVSSESSGSSDSDLPYDIGYLSPDEPEQPVQPATMPGGYSMRDRRALKKPARYR